MRSAEGEGRKAVRACGTERKGERLTRGDRPQGKGGQGPEPGICGACIRVGAGRGKWGYPSRRGRCGGLRGRKVAAERKKRAGKGGRGTGDRHRPEGEGAQQCAAGGAAESGVLERSAVRYHAARCRHKRIRGGLAASAAKSGGTRRKRRNTVNRRCRILTVHRRVCRSTGTVPPAADADLRKEHQHPATGVGKEKRICIFLYLL